MTRATHGIRRIGYLLVMDISGIVMVVLIVAFGGLLVTAIVFERTRVRDEVQPSQDAHRARRAATDDYDRS